MDWRKIICFNLFTTDIIRVIPSSTKTLLSGWLIIPIFNQNIISIIIQGWAAVSAHPFVDNSSILYHSIPRQWTEFTCRNSKGTTQRMLFIQVFLNMQYQHVWVFLYAYCAWYHCFNLCESFHEADLRSDCKYSLTSKHFKVTSILLQSTSMSTSKSLQSHFKVFEAEALQHVFSSWFVNDYYNRYYCMYERKIGQMNIVHIAVTDHCRHT